MAKNLLFLCCFCFTFAFSQSLPNSAFLNSLKVACVVPPDSVTGFLEWSAFQTTDSSVWGPKDSICFDYGNNTGNGLRIDLGQTNDSFPIFVRANLDTNNQVLLDSNTIYKLQFSLRTEQFAIPSLLIGTNCPDDLCSGISLGIKVPDSAGTGNEVRWYAGELLQNGPYLDVEFCFPTERFPLGNFISNAWIRIGQDGNNAGVKIINSTDVYIEDFRFGMEQIRAISAPGNQAYLGSGASCWPCNNLLMMYNDSTFPDANHISYVEATPIPNVATPQQLDITIDYFANLNFQPFTQLRGAQVLGDTLRHNVNLINNGGTICGYAFIDLVFQNGDIYTHRAGRLDLPGPKSCMSFGKAGKLVVDEGAVLNYGARGNGMLAFRTDGKIEIRKNAELIIGGSLVFGEYSHEHSPQKFEIHLPRGSKLSFAKGARLRNYLSKFAEETYLDVYLDGGVLDDSELSEEDRGLIRRHYAAALSAFEENLQVSGNPFSNVLEFAFISKAGIDLEASLFSLDGRLLHQQMLKSQEGHNLFSIETSNLASGVYLLQILTPYGKTVRKVLRE